MKPESLHKKSIPQAAYTIAWHLLQVLSVYLHVRTGPSLGRKGDRGAIEVAETPREVILLTG